MRGVPETTFRQVLAGQGYQQVYGHSFEDRTVIGPAFYPLRPFPLARQGLSD